MISDKLNANHIKNKTILPLYEGVGNTLSELGNRVMLGFTIYAEVEYIAAV